VSLGEVELGLQWADRALSMAPDDPHVRYNVACAYSQAKQVDRAIECLEGAEAILRQPSYLRWIENDSDLDALRDDPRFQKLLARLRTAGSDDHGAC
jgi:adenylate cyclase